MSKTPPRDPRLGGKFDKSSITKTHNVDEVESLAEEVTGGVAVVQMQGLDDVLDQSVGLGLPLLLAIDHGASHTLGYHPDLALLPLFPHPMRHIKEHALEEQHERHPLIVRVVSFLAIVATESRVGHVGAHRFRVVLRQRERVRDPAIRVDHVGRQRTVDQAIDRIACESECRL